MLCNLESVIAHIPCKGASPQTPLFNGFHEKWWYTFRHELIYDHKHRQIYDYITRASTNTGSGKYTNPDLGAMELYTHLGTG